MERRVIDTDEDIDIRPLIGKGIIILVIIIICLMVLIGVFGAMYNVPAGNVGVMYSSYGAHKGFNPTELSQGWGFKTPFVQHVYTITFQTQSIGFYGGTEERGTYAALAPKDKNGITFSVDITIRYRLDPTQASEFIEQKGQGIQAMETLLSTAARADSTRGIFGQYAQEDVPLQRIEISQQIKKILQERIDSESSGKLKPGFIIVEAVDIRNIDFNDQIEQRIIQKQTRLQEAQELVYKLDIANKTRTMELINADRDKQVNILKAEGQKQVAILQAQGEALSVLMVAGAKANATKLLSNAYQDMPASYVAVKYAEAIKPTDKIFFGLNELGGNNINMLDINKLMALQAQRSNITTGSDW